MIIGIDEVGRGCIAGPVVVCACVFDEKKFDKNMLAEVVDSKKISKKKRQQIYDRLIGLIDHVIIEIDQKIIDEINILNATLMGMKQCYDKLLVENKVDLTVIVDGNKLPNVDNKNVKAVVKADNKYVQVSLASIFAKVHRDKIMEKYGEIHPEYGFEKHAGYGTKQHIDAIKNFGILPIHRKTFEPIKSILIK